jgi:hypothetical protein
MTVDEVRILGDDDSLFSIRQIKQFLVGSPILIRQVEGVNGVTTRSTEPRGHAPGQMGIHEEVHGPTGWDRRVRASRAA